MDAKIRVVEYDSSHPRVGEIDYLDEDGFCVRTEYKPFHEDYSNIRTYTLDGIERIEYGKYDEACGVIEYWLNDEMFRVEYHSAHPLHGEVEHWEDGKHTRTEYASFHPCHGQIAYYDECGIHVTRIEFVQDHIEHGRIDHLASNGRVVSREFKDPHYNSGRTYIWDEEGNCEMVFALSHELRGQGFHFTFDGQCVKRYYGLDDEICNVV